MKISIVTVSYNSEKTIDRTIKSVLNQTYNDIEYIVVDGKSYDRTMEIVKGYKSEFESKGYSFLFSSQEDNGMYDAMNKGIELASGELIGILNSDDWYENDAIETVKTCADKVNADIYMGAIRIHNGEQQIIKRAKNQKYKTSRVFNHPAMFVRRKCYKDVGGYKIGNVHNDYGWYLKAMKLGKKVSIIDRILTNYPTGGIGSQKSLKKVKERIATKYLVYKENGYSRLYFPECVVQELMKYFLLKK